MERERAIPLHPDSGHRRMLVGDFGRLDASLRCNDEGRHQQLSEILSDFRNAFSQVRYELRLEFRLLNAQAVMLGLEPAVLLYGGLALHPQLGPDALMLALLHETGHHLATGRRLPFSSFLACECISDHWAVTTGASELRAKAGRSFATAQAVSELDCVMTYGQPFQCYDTQQGCDCCWHRSWLLRKLA